MTSEEQIAHLKAENAALREQVQTLLERGQELEGRLDEEIIQQHLLVTHRFEMQDARTTPTRSMQQTGSRSMVCGVMVSGGHLAPGRLLILPRLPLWQEMIY